MRGLYRFSGLSWTVFGSSIMRVMYTLINKLLPLAGLNMRSPIIISIKGRGP